MELSYNTTLTLDFLLNKTASSNSAGKGDSKDIDDQKLLDAVCWAIANIVFHSREFGHRQSMSNVGVAVAVTVSPSDITIACPSWLMAGKMTSEKMELGHAFEQISVFSATLIVSLLRYIYHGAHPFYLDPSI